MNISTHNATMLWENLYESQRFERSKLGRLLITFEGEIAQALVLKRVKRIVSQYPDVCKWKDTNGFLPLHKAAKEGCSVDVLQVLIDCFPEARDVKDTCNRTPLHHAISHDGATNLDILKLLITPNSARSQDLDGFSPLYSYLAKGRWMTFDVDIINSLVDACLECVILGNLHDQTPLHQAVIRTLDGDTPLFQVLVDLYPHAALEVDCCQKSPLHWACQFQSAEFRALVIQSLVDACPEAASIPDHHQKLPLHRICSASTGDLLQNIQTLVEAFPEGVKRRQDYEGRTPLHLLCQQARAQDMSAVEFLVDAYPKGLMVKDSSGCSPLHLAECYNERNMNLARFLVERCPHILQDDDMTSERGTPLHQFCKLHRFSGRSIDYLRILAISERAVAAKNSQGQTPMHLLCQSGASQDMLQILLDECPMICKKKDNAGRIPLHAAVEGCAKLEFRRYRETFQWLLEAFPQGLRVPDNEGKTPLQLACEMDIALDFIYQLVCFDPIMTLGQPQASHTADAVDGRKRKRDS